jgi:sec-independent protein translocase protein TatC
MALGVAVAFSLCYWRVDDLMAWVEAPLRTVPELAGQRLSVFTVAEGFFIKIRVAFLAAIFLSSPWTLVQLWLFVRPGLYASERRLAIPFVLFTTAFFVAGGAFGYLVGLPAMLDFLLGTAAAGFEKNIRAEGYVQTFSRLLLGMGAVFEAPVLAWFLARLGLLSAGLLVRQARVAIVVIAVLAALITPSGDIPTMVIFALPMIVLYGLSILVAWAAGRPRGVAP